MKKRRKKKKKQRNKTEKKKKKRRKKTENNWKGKELTDHKRKLEKGNKGNTMGGG